MLIVYNAYIATTADVRIYGSSPSPKKGMKRVFSFHWKHWAGNTIFDLIQFENSNILVYLYFTENSNNCKYSIIFAILQNLKLKVIK